ncbi:MAG: hypothetical protein CMK23_06065 [Porticoccaceae bacterium]|nr:hypothetical protein [Porticoccaceae bacterium]
MKITLKKTEEQVELVKAMASRNRDVAYEAQMALAEFISPVLVKVINQAPVISNLFNNFSFNEMDSPSLPLDLYYDITAPEYVKVYSTSVPGGLPTNTVVPTVSEMKFTTYRLDSAVDFDKRYAAKSRMDVVGKTFTRIAQEVLLKMEATSQSLLLGALQAAQTNGDDHFVTAKNKGAGAALILDDFNKLLTKAKRINTAWTGSAPEGGRIKGITDLIMSPEMIKGLREMAYNPVNTKGSSTDIPATDSMRDGIYNNAGTPEFFGISIMEINELGPNQKMTKAFAALDTGFENDDDLAIGLDRSRESLFRAVATDAENGSELNLVADDQYSVRQSKIGYFGSMEEGRMILDDRVLTGIKVDHQ